jgi:ATP-dependent protease HslVU (ClpYQ) peptidase subunit
MTTIIGVEYDDHCLIMADSRVTDDDGRVFSHPVMRKIANRGDLIIAGAGEVAPCDVAQNIWTPPQVTAKDKKDPYKYMITKAMPSLRKCLVENGYNFDEPKDKADSQSRFQFLIAVGGEIFDVDEDLAVMKSDKGLYAIGSGGAYALGALYAKAEPDEAMKIASEVSAFTFPPFAFETQYK